MELDLFAAGVKLLHTDRGSEFKNYVVEGILNAFGIDRDRKQILIKVMKGVHVMFLIKIDIQPSEYWYGLAALEGSKFPLCADSNYQLSLEPNPTNNQAAPLLLSNHGRYLWCKDGFDVTVSGGTLMISCGKSEPILCEGFQSLRGAYLAVSQAHFPANGKLPPQAFFSKPQYNTWIELLRNQNQQAVLDYAKAILDNGLPSGIIMIDDGWFDYYGRWEFRRLTFPDPKAMVDELHALGFEVMLWTCPFITPDSAEFMDLRERGLLVCNADGSVAVREWWNGFSAILDMTNPAATDWYDGELRKLMELYGIDGFKFDAGDAIYYRDDDKTCVPMDANGQCTLWASFAERYAYNELRAGFACQGRALVQRLADRNHSWDENGLASLIPSLLTQGILGYAFTCPDMIGGGEYSSFRGKMDHLDGELFVRSAQCSALLPMMQFSASPWRVLSKGQTQLCIEAAKLHEHFADKIFALAIQAADTGEPIVRYMEYVFPEQGFEKVSDQFMLGNEVLVAPVLQKGAFTRTVRLPEGEWHYSDGTVYQGGKVEVNAPLETLPYFIKKGL